jgi:hypothetical protein
MILRKNLNRVLKNIDRKSKMLKRKKIRLVFFFKFIFIIITEFSLKKSEEENRQLLQKVKELEKDFTKYQKELKRLIINSLFFYFIILMNLIFYYY